MKIKAERVALSKPAKDEEITGVFEKIHEIDSSLVAIKLRKDNLKDKKPLHEFMKELCIQTSYLFQVKKCLQPSCTYCKAHPVHVSPEQFSSLHYSPLPLFDASKTKYKTFESLYGSLPSSKDQPSSKSSVNPETAEADSKHKAI